MPYPTTLVLVLAIAASPVLAQARPDSVAKPCDGEIVHSVDIEPGRPPFNGSAARWRQAAHAAGLHHVTTQPDVIRAFLSLREGEVCSERRRLESERVLRAQQFIADAQVFLTRDSAGSLIAHVRTTDEIPALVGARFHGVGFPQALSAGDGNVGGMGALLDAGYERKVGYRTGFGGRLVASAVFGHPYRFTIDGMRASLGHRLRTAFEHPLFTDIQHIAWQASYQSDDAFLDIARAAGDPLALEVTQDRWAGSGIARVFGQKTILVLGLSGSRVNLVPADTGILITDQGLRPDTGIVLRSRYRPFLVTRAGIIAGVRHVQFTRVIGFDGLFAAQDIPSGFMVGVMAAKSLPSLGEQDGFLSSAAYAGRATSWNFLGAAVEVEGRRNDSNRWDSVIGSSRGAAYFKASPTFELTLSNEFSGGSRSRLPLQLSFSDMQGGLRGYKNADLAGAQRDVVRAEVRRSGEAAVARADVGVALFTDLGRVWAGDAPYGVTTTRQSVGISLLAAYPTRSKRIYRLDVGVPLNRSGSGAGRLELRITSEDRTDRFWAEPGDVLRARTGSAPSTLFGWQSP